MTTYYVSPFGSDSNNGLGPDPTGGTNKPWLTPGKALGAAGIAGADTVYMGPGRYQIGATTTIAMTSPVAETFFLGDPWNQQGFRNGQGTRLPGGDVRWSAWAAGERGNDSRTLLSLNGRDFLTFKNIAWIGAIGHIIDGSTATSTDIKFQDCWFGGHPGASNILRILGSFGVAANWTIERCVLYGSSGHTVEIFLGRGTGADYDANIIIRNCYLQGTGSNRVLIESTGAGVNLGGGVRVLGSTLLGALDPVKVNDANISTTVPNRVYGCQLYAGAGTCLTANVAGQIVEDYNRLAGVFLRGNVTAGVHSVSQPNVLFEGHRHFANGSRKQYWFTADRYDTHLGFGHDATYNPGTEDVFGLPRPNGTVVFADEGTASAGAAKTLTDSTKAWATNYFAGFVVKILSGTGSGQVKQIASNTSTVLTVDGNWVTNPDATSTYVIYFGALASSGQATAGAATTVTDANAAWATDQWIGWTLEIRSGTGSGQSRTVSTNSATVLTVGSAFGTTPDATSQYWLYRGTDENTCARAVGCSERPDTFFQDAVTFYQGPSALRALGPATQDFEVPVSAELTTIDVYVKSDAYYSGTLPQLKVVNGQECGVSDATTTATAAAGVWEHLTLSFTPTREGIVTIRLQSNSTTPTGSCWFDTLNVTRP